jgi:phage terminase small subunit
MSEKKLTDKQKIFCKEYIIDFNATRAAKASGYSVKTAGRIGGENVQKPEIQKQIKKLMSKREERTEISADRVVKELAKIGFSNEFDIEGFTRLEMKDKIKAIELLGRHVGAFNNDESGKSTIKVTVGKPNK